MNFFSFEDPKAGYDKKRCLEISALFRAKCSEFSRKDLLYFEKSLYSSLGFNSLRYTQLTTRDGRITRSFLHLGLGDEEFRKRKIFLTALLGNFSGGKPSKTKRIDYDANENRAIAEFTEYAHSGFTLDFLIYLRPAENSGIWLWTYLTDSDRGATEDFNDDELPTLDDLLASEEFFL